MKISFLVLKGLPFPGGIERYMEEVGPRLVAKGHRVRLYSIGYRTTVPRDHAGMTIRTVPAVRMKSLEKASAAAIATAWETLGDSDIVHVHAFGAGLFSIIPRLAGKKVVVQGHGVEWRRSKWGWGGRNFLRFAEWASIRGASAVTVVSRTQQAYLKQRYGLDAAFIPPGVAPASLVPPLEIKQRLGLEGKDFILFAARLEREKGLGYLIEAYRSLRPRMKLVVAGDNPLDERYKQELRDLAAGDPGIVFTGFATGRFLRELFSNCYLFVLPSELEGLPIAALEAMSYRCGCLVSDIPENREALAGHGFTFRNKDPVDLAARLSALLEDPARVERVGASAQAFVTSRYSWDTVADELDALYRNTVASGSISPEAG